MLLLNWIHTKIFIKIQEVFMKLSLWILKDHLSEYNPKIILSATCTEPESESVDTLAGIEKLCLYHPLAVQDEHTLLAGTEDDFWQTGSERILCCFHGCFLQLETTDLHQIFNRILEIFYFYNDLEQKWTELIHHNCSCQQLLDMATELFHAPLLLFDSSDTLLAYSLRYETEKIDSEWTRLMQEKATPAARSIHFHTLANGLLRLKESDPYCIPADTFSPHSTYNQNIYCQGEWCGICVMVEYGQTFTLGIIHLFHIICRFLQLCMERDAQQQDSPLSALFLSQVLAGEDDKLPQLSRRLRIDGWKEGDQLLMIRVVSTLCNSGTHHHLCRILSSYSPFLMVSGLGNGASLLCNISKLESATLFHFLEYHLKQGSYCCGVSYPFTQLSDLMDACNQADIALYYGQASGTPIHRIENYMLPYLMNHFSQHTGNFQEHPLLRSLKEYDRLHDTNYYQTLFVFLRCERNHTIASAELHIHRNTLFRRLEKLQEEFRLNLDNAQERFCLLFSFYLKQGFSQIHD